MLMEQINIFYCHCYPHHFNHHHHDQFHPEGHWNGTMYLQFPYIFKKASILTYYYNAYTEHAGCTVL